MAYHKDEILNSLHVLHAFEYADSTARLAASGLSSSDIGKIARQSDTGEFFILEDDSPLTWKSIIGSDADGGTF